MPAIPYPSLVSPSFRGILGGIRIRSNLCPYEVRPMPRKATPLTDSAIRVVKPKDSPYKPIDGQGLYLEVTPNGSKLWRR